MNEYLVLMLDRANDVCGSWRVTARNADSIRWSNMTYDMISFSKTDIYGLLIINLDKGTYRKLEL